MLQSTQWHSSSLIYDFMLEEWHRCGLPACVRCSDALTSLTGPPSSTGPNPSLDILGLLQLRQETHELREGKRPLKGKTRTLKTKQKKDLRGPKNIYFSPSQWIQQNVPFNILSWCRFDLFKEGLWKSLSVHHSPILEMLLEHEYFLRGTKEKCFCAEVYDK